MYKILFAAAEQGLTELVISWSRNDVHDVKRSESGEILLRPGLPASAVMFQVVTVIYDLEVKIPPCFFMGPALNIDGAGKNVHLAFRIEPGPVGPKDPSRREPEPE
jgi:hypothetical protein